MFRFYCTIENKIKRVQHKPKLIENAELLDPSLRLGQCDSHFRIKPTIIKTNRIESNPIETSVNKMNKKRR